MKELIKPVLEEQDENIVIALCESNECGINCIIMKNSSAGEEDDIIF
jgi:hypothetical protein